VTRTLGEGFIFCVDIFRIRPSRIACLTTPPSSEKGLARDSSMLSNARATRNYRNCRECGQPACEDGQPACEELPGEQRQWKPFQAGPSITCREPTAAVATNPSRYSIQLPCEPVRDPYPSRACTVESREPCRRMPLPGSHARHHMGRYPRR